MKNKMGLFLSTILLISCAIAVSAQESPLGSSVEASRRYSNNYAEIVRAALPKADAAMLTKLLANVRAAAAEEKPLAIADPRQFEKTFGLRERGQADASGYLDVGEAVYRVDAERQRFYLVRRYADAQPVPRKEFERELKAIQQSHRQFTEQVGFPSKEIFFTDFREILSETDGHPELEKGVKGEIMSAGAVTTVLRTVGGIMVEGSYLRLSSIDAKRLELMDLRWPAIRLSAPTLRKGLRSPADSIPAITKRIAAESKGQPVNVRMAIVLRPVMATPTARATEFVPSLKVGVVPQAVKTEGGYRTDAGEEFFIDLIKGAPAFADPVTADTLQEAKQ
ncbi:MAG TPA: hypothetical protein VLK33_19070 [Terriglobales bacterium]|nr:hypothetical protein [Terriglobales bacterium]